MAWYDYIPVVGSVARLAQGDYKHAGADIVPVIGPYAYDTASAFDEKKAGYQNAQKELGQLAEQQRAFQMQGLKQAEGYYRPAEERLRSLYGDTNSFRK